MLHDDVIKWKHSPHKGQWRGALMFSLIYAWINDRVNNREAGGLRRQRGHYDVIVIASLWHGNMVFTSVFVNVSLSCSAAPNNARPSVLTMLPTNVCFNTLRPRQNRCLFADDIFKCIFLNENVWISIQITLKFVPMGPINNIPSLVQIMAWHRPGDTPLSEPMMVSLMTRICVTRPQWVEKHIIEHIIWNDRRSFRRYHDTKSTYIESCGLW